MFTIKSNPFAEMTRGLSGQYNIKEEPTTVYEPVIRKEHKNHYEYTKNSSSNWWKVILILLFFLSGIGLIFWIHANHQKKKEEERKELEEKR